MGIQVCYGYTTVSIYLLNLVNRRYFCTLSTEGGGYRPLYKLTLFSLQRLRFLCFGTRFLCFGTSFYLYHKGASSFNDYGFFAENRLIFQIFARNPRNMHFWWVFNLLLNGMNFITEVSSACKQYFLIRSK